MRVVVHLRPRLHEVDRARGVDVEAAVAVGVAIDDVVGQQAGVAGVELAVRAQLAARRHPDGRVAQLGPRLRQRRLGDVARHDQQRRVRRRQVALLRAAVPAGDPQAVQAVVADLENVDLGRSSACGTWLSDGLSGIARASARIAAQKSSKSGGRIRLVWNASGEPRGRGTAASLERRRASRAAAGCAGQGSLPRNSECRRDERSAPLRARFIISPAAAASMPRWSAGGGNLMSVGAVSSRASDAEFRRPIAPSGGCHGRGAGGRGLHGRRSQQRRQRGRTSSRRCVRGRPVVHRVGRDDLLLVQGGLLLTFGRLGATCGATSGSYLLGLALFVKLGAVRDGALDAGPGRRRGAQRSARR